MHPRLCRAPANRITFALGIAIPRTLRAMPHEYLQPYRRAVERFGPTFEATLWSSPEAQIIRFDVMIDLADMDGCTILDAGCGRGDFAARLLERDVNFARYVGVDAVSQMIEAARERALPRSEFLTGDVLVDPGILQNSRADYVCMSGTLNTMEQAIAQGLVSAAFTAAAQGVVFNFLSDRAHPRWAARDIHPARRFNTAAMVDWALSLTSRVSFTQDYLDGHDATILLRHV